MKTASLVAAVAACSLSAMASAAFESAQFGGAYSLKYGESNWTATQSTSNFVGAAYDSTNYATSGATGYGAGGTSSTDLAAVYGDSMTMSGGLGSTLDSFKFALFCSSSSAAALTGATETISFYRQSDSSMIGQFQVSIGALAKGYFSVYTITNLAGIGITFDTNDVIVTQQLSSVGGATRMGTVFGTAAGAAPAVGSTTAGLYMSNATTPAGFYTFTGYSTNSNGVFQLNTVDAPAPGALALLGVAGIAGKRRRR